MSSPYRPENRGNADDLPATSGDSPTISYSDRPAPQATSPAVEPDSPAAPAESSAPPRADLPADDTMILPASGGGTEPASPSLVKNDRGSTAPQPTESAHVSYPAPSYPAPSFPEPSYSPSYRPEPSHPEPAYSAPSYGSSSTVTSVYPQSQPGYAPENNPPTYAPATVVPPPAPPVTPEKTSSRVGAGFLCALLGLLLSAAGLLLLAKYGFAAGRDLANGTVRIKDSGLALVGAVLVLVAFVLDGWSPWATILPGLALTALGGWALFDHNAYGHIGTWTSSLLKQNELGYLSITGFAVALGLAMLGASVAVMLARSSGKRDGRILQRRESIS